MEDLKVREGIPLSIIYNTHKYPVSNPAILSKAGFAFVTDGTVCSSNHQLKSVRGECLECNQHLLKRGLKEYATYQTHLFENIGGLYVTLVFSPSSDRAYDQIVSGLKSTLGDWKLLKSYDELGVDFFNKACASLTAYETPVSSSAGVMLSNMYSAPSVLATSVIDRVDHSVTPEWKTLMFDKITFESDGLMSKLQSKEVAFLKDLGVTDSQLIDATGLGTKEYKQRLSSESALLAINAYPCNEHGHRIRNINNACVQCKPEKTFDDKYVSKTPERKFIDASGVPEGSVYDLKGEQNKDFKAVLESSNYLVAINTYRCKKCGMGVRNQKGSCLKCKPSKLKEVMASLPKLT